MVTNRIDFKGDDFFHLKDIEHPHVRAEALREHLKAREIGYFAKVRIERIFLRLFFATVNAACLLAMKVSPVYVLTWLLLVYLTQIFEVFLAKRTFEAPLHLAHRQQFYFMAILAALTYCSIAPFAWFSGEGWAKLSTTWFVIGSIVAHTTSEHRIQKMRTLMMMPYLVVLPILAGIEIVVHDGVDHPQIIALAVMFTSGIIYFISMILKNFKLTKIQNEEMFQSEWARLNADDANFAKSQFLNNISHDLRDPLNAMLGSAVLLRQSLKSPMNLQLLDTLLESGKGMVALLNELLDHSKIEAGVVEVKSNNFAPEDLIGRIADLWESNIIDKGLEFICDYHGQLPNALLGDDERIFQIANNFIANALRHTKIGWICLSASYQDGIFELKIIDSAGADLSKDIDNFVALEEFESSKSDFAISLGNCDKLAKIMGGEIEFSVQKNGGTSYILRLPLDKGDVDKVQNHIALRNFDSNNAVDESNLRVLAAEDNAANRLILGRFLDSIGASAEIVEDGAKAILRANENVYDVILLDIRMPKTDGLEACRQIRSHSRLNSETPIIMISADAAQSQIQFGLEAGADGYLPKPIDTSKLFRLLATASNGRGAFNNFHN